MTDARPTTSYGANAAALNRVVHGFERGIVIGLLSMMMLVVALSTLELGWLILVDVSTPPIVLLEIEELLEIFGFFLLVLIGVELLETIKAYLRDNVIHVEIVAEVALIALARKVIVLDFASYDGVTVLAMAALIIALAAALVMTRKLSASRRRLRILGGSRTDGATHVER
jgi:uncharacterized membrane protein (DUF373 family)